MTVKRGTFILIFLLLGSSLCLMTGGKKPKSTSGFLTEYPKMEKAPAKSKGDSYLWRAKMFNLGKYNKFILEPVVVYMKNNKADHGVRPDELAQLAEFFRESAVEALGKDYEMITEPGKDVLLVRVAIVDVVIGNPALVTATMVGPGAMLSLGKKLTTGSSIGVGEAGIEVEFLDSQTREQLLVYISHKTGSKHQFGASTSTWGHAKKIIDGWIKQFREKLDQSRV